MGRGLSDLQKAVLVMAHENGLAGDDAYSNWDGTGEHPPHVKRERILREYFGWEPTNGRPRLTTFSKKDIGAKRYNSTMASLSRSLHRLEGRELVVFTHSMLAGGWSGVELTEAGQAEAEQILERQAGR